jgi:hypothetical protein
VKGVPSGQQPRGGIGSDELNLAEFPLATFDRRVNPKQKTLVFEDDIFDEGARQRVHRKLVISASDAFGLPTPADADVLLVLLWLTTRPNCPAIVACDKRPSQASSQI